MDPTSYGTEPGRYLVSTWGRLYDNARGTFAPRELIKPINDYVRVYVSDVCSGKFMYIAMHRIIASTFVFPKPVGNARYVVPNHVDGVKWHNEPYNLRWATQKENCIHASINNLKGICYGEDNGYSELSDDQYREICRLTQEGFWPYQINKIMNVGFDITNIAQNIRTGKTGRIISDNEFDFSNIPRNEYRKFSEDQVRQICKILQDFPGIQYLNILKIMGYDIENMNYLELKKLRNTISTIKRRKSYIEIGKEYNF